MVDTFTQCQMHPMHHDAMPHCNILPGVVTFCGTRPLLSQVDAALDSRAASRVAQYIAQQTGGGSTVTSTGTAGASHTQLAVNGPQPPAVAQGMGGHAASVGKALGKCDIHSVGEGHREGKSFAGHDGMGFGHQGGAGPLAGCKVTLSSMPSGAYSGAQYIVVSHRPQVFERAPCLIGVYTLGGASRAVLGRFAVPSVAR